MIPLIFLYEIHFINQYILVLNYKHFKKSSYLKLLQIANNPINNTTKKKKNKVITIGRW